MQAKDKIEFIKKVFQNNENLCENLTDKQYRELVESCNNHIEIFKQEVCGLLDNYNTVSKTLIDKEEKIKQESAESNALLQKTAERYAEFIKTINNTVAESQQINPLYDALTKTLLTYQENITQQLNLIIKDSNAMHSAIQNSGIITFHKRLEFCIKILLDITPNAHDENSNNHYTEIARILSQFCYEDSIGRYDNIKQNFSLEKEKRKSSYELLSLVLTFITDGWDSALISNSCLKAVQTESFSLQDLSHLTLEGLSKEHPARFIQLYQYLFNEKHEFSDQVEHLIQQKHIYASFNKSLFELRAVHAYNIEALKTTNLAEKEQYQQNAKNCKTNAFKTLLVCLKNDFAKAEDVLKQYFADNTDLHMDIELANHYYTKDKVKAQGYSKKIHNHIKDNSHLELSQLPNDIHQLFYNWIVNETDELNSFGQQNLFNFVSNENKIAYGHAKELAKTKPQLAVLFAKTILQVYGLNEKKEALSILEAHKSEDHEIYYYRFLLQKAVDGKEDYDLLIKAAGLNNGDAIAHLRSLLNHNNVELRKNTYRKIIMALNEKSQVFINLLEECYFNGLLPISEYADSGAVIDQLILFLYPQVLRSMKQNETTYFLEELCTKVNFCSTTYDKLVNEAKHHFPTAHFLLEYGLKKDPNSTKLVTLKSIVKSHYDRNLYNEKTYELYFRYGIVGDEGFDLLISSCESGSAQAISQVINMVNSIIKNPTLGGQKSVNVIPACIVVLEEIASKPDGYLATEALCIYFTKLNLIANAKKYSSICSTHQEGPAQLKNRLISEKLYDKFIKFNGDAIFKAPSKPRQNIEFFERHPTSLKTDTLKDGGLSVNKKI